MFPRLLIAVTLAAKPAVARTVTDSAGRTVEVPDDVDIAFAYVMAPETPTG